MPWKGESDPYRIWLSEIILQQTRVEQGTAYYEKFISVFPTIMIWQKLLKKKFLNIGKGWVIIADAGTLFPQLKKLHLKMVAIFLLHILKFLRFRESVRILLLPLLHLHLVCLMQWLMEMLKGLLPGILESKHL